MPENPATIEDDSTPHASLGNDEADQAGSCFPSLKKPLSVSQLAEHLIDKGLQADSKKSIERALEVHGYYRLRGYWISLERKGKFKKGATLHDILEIEAFDREISLFLFSAIGEIEILMRSQLATILGCHYGPRALHSADVFRDRAAYVKLQHTLKRETEQALSSQKPLAKHNIEKYGALPLWAELENASLGTLSKLYGNLSDKQVASELSKYFGISWPYLSNWLRHLTQIRNICAHHDRLYNKMFTVRPRLFKEHKDIPQGRLFPTLIVLLRLNESIDLKHANLMRKQLGSIVDSHPGIDLNLIGFPKNWREVLKVPQSDAHDIVRPRGRQGGRPLKDAETIEHALYLYDMHAGTVAEIAHQCKMSLSTLYKYIHLRKEVENAERITYESISLEDNA